MKTTLSAADVDALLGPLGEANRRQSACYPGEPEDRQPVHTVYGGAQLFVADTPKKLGELALAHLRRYGAGPEDLEEALELPTELARHVHRRVVQKLEREPVEDFRIDFEDGFGVRPDAEEDHHAERAAREVARGMKEGLLSPFIGIRIKPFNEEMKRRSVRTLDGFVSTLLAETGGRLPPGFVVTLPKVPVPEQVEAFVGVLERLERAHGLPPKTLRLELMIELTQSILDAGGRSVLPLLVRAAQGRCRGAHFGTYDYTASYDITAHHQVMDHPACDFAKHMMKVAFAGTGITLSDGATNVMPVGPHKGKDLGDEEQAENRRIVHGAWKLAFDHIQHSLRGGFYQGWDLHPGQLVPRYAACYAFFLDGLQAASARLRNFIDKAAQATLVGDVFDDAATGQGLLNYFLRALGCGAIDETELGRTGLDLDDIQTRSFVKILERRRK
jgi:citrate lyase beta subunit